MSKIKFYTSDDQVYFEMEEEQPTNKKQRIQELTERIENSQAEIDALKEELEKLQKKPYEIGYPKDGEKIYYISFQSGQVKEWDFNINYEADKCLYDIGLYFDTEEEAEQFKREQTLIKKIKCWTKEQQGDWEPDWSNTNQRKYYVEINRFRKKITYDWYWEHDKFPKLPYFKTGEITRACIDEFGNEILEVFC